MISQIVRTKNIFSIKNKLLARYLGINKNF